MHFRKTYVSFFRDSGWIRVRMRWIKRAINIFETYNFKEIASTATSANCSANRIAMLGSKFSSKQKVDHYEQELVGIYL
jgi:hypothetical protein